jgi:hypothetical protein
MKKKLFVILIIFATSIVVFPQANRLTFGLGKPIQLLDTINVFVGEHFEIKDKLSDWSTNFGDLTYTLGVYLDRKEDANNRRITFEKNIGGLEYYRGRLSYSNVQGINLKSNVEKGVNPGDYEIQLSLNINTAGVYYFVGLIKGKSERGGYFEDAGYWVVNCTPRAQRELTHEIKLQDTYYFGESVYLDFSLSGEGMDNISNYYFRIFESDKEIFSGLGSYINLGTITKNTAMVNRSFRIEGYYGGRIIQFFNPSLPGPDSTVWNFKLLPPKKFETFTNWLSEEEFNSLSENDIIDAMDLRLNENRKFKFMYFSPIENGAIVTFPEMKNLSVTVSPPDFLVGSSNKFRAYNEGIWKIIELNVNSRFLSSIPDNATRKIILQIKYTTQFGELKDLTYVGYVF